MKIRSKIIVFGILFILGFSIFYSTLTIKDHYLKIYNEAVSFLEAGDYDAAIARFEEIPNYTEYRDVSELLINYKIDVCPHCGHILK